VDSDTDSRRKSVALCRAPEAGVRQAGAIPVRSNLNRLQVREGRTDLRRSGDRVERKLP
jgi:hypothetical protein